ncbi:hypothetical protein GCM10027414_07080 [Humibacter ginsengiterrae]
MQRTLHTKQDALLAMLDLQDERNELMAQFEEVRARALYLRAPLGSELDVAWHELRRLIYKKLAEMDAEMERVRAWGAAL